MVDGKESPVFDFKSACGRILKNDALNLCDVITVNVGKENVRFSVLESVIRKSSRFFDKAMKPDWALSRPDPRLIDMSDEDPEIFKIYIHWLYFKTIPTVSPESSEAQLEHLLLSKCYVLGVAIIDNGFKNAVLTAIVDATLNQPILFSSFPCNEAISVIYEGTNENAPGRRLLIALWVRYADDKWAEQLVDTLPKDFMLDLSRALLQQKKFGFSKRKRPFMENITEYYE